MILILFMYACFALSFTVGKNALDYGPPFFLTAVRFTLAGILLLWYWIRRTGRLETIRPEDYGDYIRVVIFHVMGAYLLEFWALQYITSIKACLLYNLSPIVTALLAWWIFSDRITFKQWIGLFIGCLGFIPLLSTADSGEMLQSSLFSLSLAEIVLIGGIISSCYGWMVVKRLMGRGYHAVFSNGIGMLLGGLLSFPISIWYEGAPHIKPAYTGILSNMVGMEMGGILFFIINLLLLMLLSNLIGYTLYGYLLRKYSATFVAFMGLTTPLFAAVFGVVLRHETVGLPFIISAIVVTAGLFLYYQDELKSTAV